jgi:ribose transport system ATP-binding protein
MNDDVLFEARGLAKDFGPVRALSGADLTVARGSIHGLVGPNGAGKSTLVHVAVGSTRPDAGQLYLDGSPVEFRRPREAQAAGISLVPQHLAIIPKLSVAENIVLGDEPARWTFLDKARATADARATLGRLGLALPLGAEAGSLGPAHQRMIMIARGLYRSARLLILDEPTSTLNPQEAASVAAALRRLRDDGTAIVYVSHRFDEIVDLCERATVMRDGRTIDVLQGRDLTERALVRAIAGVGNDESVVDHGAGGSTSGRPLLACRGISAGRQLQSVDFEARAGEVVAVIGLSGSGAESLLLAISGVLPITAGSMEVEGRAVTFRTPADALAHGIGFLAGDRTRSAITSLTVGSNVVLSSLPRISRGGFISRKQERESARTVLEPLGLAPRIDHPLWTLSGGNQQRALLARLVLAGSKTIVLDDPTQGVDVHARAVLHAWFRDLAASGRCVILSTSEYEEVVGLADRAYVFAGGRVCAQLSGEAITYQNLLTATASSGARVAVMA